MNNIENAVIQIMKYVGGKENIESVTHCMTRLRLFLKDESLEDKENLEKIKGVIKVVHAGGQVQIVIGQQVGKVYEELCRIGGFEKKESIGSENNEVEKKKEKWNFKLALNKVMSTLSGCIIPILPVFIAAGIFKMFAVLLGPEHFAILNENSDLMKLFEMVGNAGYYFLPFYTAYSASKKFEINPIMALLFVGVMMSPEMMAMVEARDSFSVYGIPVYMVNYSQAVIPVILITWAMSYFEKYLKKILPDMLRTIGIPVITMVVMLPVGLCLLGPVCYLVMSWVASGLLWLTANFGLLAIAIVAPLWPFVVMFGMHVPILTTLLPAQMEIGYDSIVYVALIVGTFTQMALFLAYALRTKGADKKSLGWSCFTTLTLANISEPGLYGIILADKKALVYSLFGNFCGGVTCYLLNADVYIFSGVGFPFLNPLRFGPDIVQGIIGCVVSFAVTFLISIIFGFQGEKKINIKRENN